MMFYFQTRLIAQGTIFIPILKAHAQIIDGKLTNKKEMNFKSSFSLLQVSQIYNQLDSNHKYLYIQCLKTLNIFNCKNSCEPFLNYLQVQSNFHSYNQLRMDFQYSQRSTKLSQQARQGFVQKVYTTISIQLMVTVAFVYINYSSKSFAKFQATKSWAFWVAFIGSIVSLLSLFYGKISRAAPTNYIVLSIFTIFESYLVSCICSMYTSESVLLSATATLSATLGLTVYAMTTKEDFTTTSFFGKGLMSSLAWIALSISLINWIFIKSNAFVMLVAGIFAVIYSVYILYDTQLIIGGKNKQLSLDDYILGATILYVDIISLFLKILQILGKKKDD